MNIIFWILVIAVLVLIWFCLSGIYRAIGRCISAFARDAADALNKREDDEK